MLDTLLRHLAPVEIAGPLLGAGLAWGALHYTAIAPEIAERMPPWTRCRPASPGSMPPSIAVSLQRKPTGSIFWIDAPA
ncbi:MAG: hypothetical protein AAGI34_18505 [Pseudomonadota bacterium]